MSQTSRRVTLADVLPLVQQLSAVEKVQLIEAVAPEIERELAAARPASSKSLLGLARDLGPAPSADEIDAARREAWQSFPRNTD